MFEKGDRIHLHDGSVVTVRRKGAIPKRATKRRKGEMVPIRGFVRGALVDALTGEERVGDWHENVITSYGHGMVIKNFAGLAGSSAALWWGIGSMTATTDTANHSLSSKMDTEYAYTSTGGSSNRAPVTENGGTQTLSGTWTLSQSHQFPATSISHSATLNAIAQYANSATNAGSALSIACFASSTKGSTQALNVTYNWAFSTALAGLLLGGAVFKLGLALAAARAAALAAGLA